MAMQNARTSGESNTTKVSLEDEEDDLPEMTLDEFKERYRRLIPYMTFYVANNYVNNPIPLLQATPKDPSPLSRKIQHPFIRVASVPRRAGGKYRVPPQIQEKKFIPSVQYDPREIGGDNDYFTPVRYNSKSGYDDYPGAYQLYQNQKSSYPGIATASGQLSHKENRYYANVRPLRPYPSNGRDHFRKQQKPIHQTSVQDDYALDYVGRPSGGSVVNYSNKDFEGLRYVPSQNPNAKIHEQSAVRQQQQQQQPVLAQIPRNPTSNLNQIIESLQLSERLPEMLNKDNIDNSIKTLVEILNILHSSKKEEFPQLQGPPLPPFAPPLSRYPQKLPGYESYKPRLQTRPKVVTETRFQATPSPLLLTDDPERYKATYDDVEEEEEEVNVKSSLPAPPNYNVNSLTNEKAIEYYTPIVQDVPEGGKVSFRPTIRPPVDESTGHSYEITEDLSDDVLQDERFTLPISTEEPGNTYTQANEIPHRAPNLPKSSVKYGATRGKPNEDYPAYATIPETDFSCKEQRYKGFFGDPATGCQVWHYCDLNGGKSSFLCPNGTIFSQVALTCDWWFNVKCETTTQLYVLNERLYKYILPIMPKFPEDFTGPEVDRYLEIKFKEMEAKLKEKKLKKQQEEKEKLKNKLQSLKEDDESSLDS